MSAGWKNSSMPRVITITMDYESWYEDDWEGWDDYEDDWDWIDWLFFEDDDYWEDDSWDEWGSDQSWAGSGNGRSDCMRKQLAC